jgi:5-dehydro-2-deoxygluconokinase
MVSLSFDASRRFDVIPLGRAAIDFNPVDVNQPLHKCQVFHKYLGGSPANIAVGLARLGKKVGFIGKVSADQFGTYIVDFFSREGIDVSHLTRARAGISLGLAFTEVLSPTESSILMHRTQPADLQLEMADVTAEYIAATKILLVSGTALAASPSREATLKAVELARKSGTPIVFDIDYRPYNWNNLDEVAIYCALVGRSAAVILGSRDEYDLMETFMVDKPASDEETARRWMGFGARLLVIKHGKQGSNAFATDGERYRVRPFPVTAAKSTGGGDGYASALLYGLLEGWGLAKALEFGSASASMLVAAPSCADAMPTVAALDDFIAAAGTRCGDVVTRE